MGARILQSSEDFYTDLAVGEILRRARMSKGITLEQAEIGIRIRAVHLEALERSDFDALPGRVYVIGFIRAYAEYLDLDGGRVVHLLKRQSQGLGTPQSLNITVLPSDSRLPGASIVAATFAAIIMVVVIWAAYQNSRIGNIPGIPTPPSAQDQINAPQDNSKPAIPPNTASSAPSPITQPAPASAPQPAAQAPAPILQQDVSAASEPPQNLLGAASHTEPAVPAPATTPQAAAAQFEPQAGEASAPEPAVINTPADSASVTAPEPAVIPAPMSVPAAPTISMQEPAVIHPADPKPQLIQASAPASTVARNMAIRDPQVAAPPPQEIVPVPSAASPAPAPAIPNIQEAAQTVGIVISVSDDSWVELRNPAGRVVQARIFRKGENLAVDKVTDANGKPYTLTTNNAGAIDVTINGKKLPALGVQNAVRRAIPLLPN